MKEERLDLMKSGGVGRLEEVIDEAQRDELVPGRGTIADVRSDGGKDRCRATAGRWREPGERGVAGELPRGKTEKDSDRKKEFVFLRLLSFTCRRR